MRKPFLAFVVVVSSIMSGPAFAQARPEADMCLVPPGAQPPLPARLLDGQGDTHMPVTTTSPEAQKFFNQGVAQLHSFWAMEAERSFLQAATLDPNMAMAYWGIGMIASGDYRPAFQLLRANGGKAPAPAQSVSPESVPRTANGAAVNGQVRAREYAEKAMALRDKVTPRERLYIDALWARRNPATKDPDADYIAGMRKLVTAFPDDLEARSMLGLALLDGYDSVTREPRAHTLEGLTLLEQVVAHDDNHFGAHHYLIHGYEGGKTPEKAWHACARYPELVPNIPHALHMPGHIYAQSDRAPDAVKAFADAAANELTWINADVLYSNGHHAHNVHFLVQALNLEGRFGEAMQRVHHMMADFKETPRERNGNSQVTMYRQAYFSLVKTLVRFEKWNEILDGRTLPVYDKPEQQVWRHYAVGLAHAALGHAAEAKTSLAELDVFLSQVTANKEPFAIAALELKATIAGRSGDTKQANEWFRQAADRETAQLYTEPPAYPRPVAEGWANVAFAARDFATAERAYREALVREPGYGRAYFGLAATLTALGRPDEARAIEDKARVSWARADKDLLPFSPATRTTASGPGQRH